MIILVGIAGSLRHNDVAIGDVVISDRVKYYQPDKIRQCSANELFVSDPAAAHQLMIQNAPDKTGIFIDPRKRYLENSFLRYRRDAIVWNQSFGLYQDTLIEANYIPFNLVPFTSDGGSDELANDVASVRAPIVHFGAVLGSDWVIDSAEFVEFLLSRDTDRASDVYTQKYRSVENERSEWIEDDLLSVDTESYGFFRGLRDIKGDSAGGPAALVVRGISDLASSKEEHDRGSSGRARDIAARNAVNAALAIVDRN